MNNISTTNKLSKPIDIYECSNGSPFGVNFISSPNLLGSVLAGETKSFPSAQRFFIAIYSNGIYPIAYFAYGGGSEDFQVTETDVTAMEQTLAFVKDCGGWQLILVAEIN